MAGTTTSQTAGGSSCPTPSRAIRRAGDLPLLHERVVEGEQRVLRAVDHERRDAYLAEPLPHGDPGIHHGEVVGLARRDVDVAIVVAAREVAHGRLVEGVRTTRVHAFEGDGGVDHGLPVRPVGDNRFPEVGTDLFRHGRKVGTTRGSRYQGERCDPVGVIESHELGDEPAHRHAHQVGAPQAEGIEHPDRVLG